MKNKLSKGLSLSLSLSANPKCLIKGTFSAVQHVFIGFGRKNDTFGNNALRTKLTGGMFPRFSCTTFNVILRRYSLLEVPWRRIHNVIAKAMSICVAAGNKVRDTRLPQPAGCGDKYDVSGLDLKHLLNTCCLSLKYPSPDAKASPSPAGGEGLPRPWCDKILGTDCASRPRMTGGRDTNPLGRSMIEMLGVLAIIAVLSVGGIAGYSKAMEKWKVDKAIEGYSMLVFGILEHIDDLRKSTADNTNIDVETLLALNIIPQSWKNSNNIYNVIDNYNNWVRVWKQSGSGLVIDIYLSAPAANADGNSVTENTSVTLCRELFTNLFMPLHAEALYTSVYVVSKGNYIFYGDKYCKNSQIKCMSSATPVQINEACNYCGKTGDFCNFNIHF